jgi:hypothetical protein
MEGLNIYQENGYKNRRDYLKSLAEECDVDFETVCVLASVLGPTEDFDALVTEIQDYAD